jgi:Concanavalin A-like lectin/glucanases superfamily
MTSTYVQLGSNPTGYPTASQLPPVASNGMIAVALDTGFLYEYNANTPGWQLIGAGSSGVASVNGLTGSVDVTAGTGTSVAVSGQDVVVTNTGVTSLNGQTGTVDITAGTGISVSASGGNVQVTNTAIAPTFADSIVNTSGTVTLVGDASSPGDSMYYGTNPSGTKGYYLLPVQSITPVTLTGITGATTINWALSDNWIIDLVGASTFSFTNAVAGESILLRLFQNGTGSLGVTWPSNLFWANNSALVASGANKMDEVMVNYDGTNFYATFAANFPTSAVFSDYGSLQTNGSTSYVSFGNTFSFTNSTAFSISLWINVASFPSFGTIFGKEGTGAGNPGYALGIFSHKLYWEMQDPSGGYIAIEGSTTLSASTWYHVVLTSSGSGTAAGCTMYVNAAAQTPNVLSDTLSGSIVNTEAFCIGILLGQGDELAANFNQMTIYNGVAISSSTVTALYNSGTPNNPTSQPQSSFIESWIPLCLSTDSATASNGIADSVNGNPGTGVGTPVIQSGVVP